MMRPVLFALAVCGATGAHAADLIRTDAHAHWQGEQILIASHLNLAPDFAAPKATKKTTMPEQTHTLEAQALFSTNSVNLRDPAALAPLIHDLQQHTPTVVTVSGYTDSTGSSRYNQTLSLRRARAVIHVLQKAAAQHRYQAQGFGESQPVASNQTLTGRSQNRRVVIEVKP